jgi:hypothetical protein
MGTRRRWATGLLAALPLCLASNCDSDRVTHAEPDTTPPAAVTDLVATAVNDSTLLLTWTAPGDDGSSGTASWYEVRYSTVRDTMATWWEEVAVVAPDPPLTHGSGTPERFVVRGLSPGTTYYLALKAADEGPNWSAQSNCATCRTTRESHPLILVRPDGTGDFPTLQTAVDAARSGDLIELAEGVYRGEGNRDVDFRGKAIIVRSRGGAPDACIIDCEGGPHAGPGGTARHSRGFVFQSGEGSGSVLEGVTIVNGYGVMGSLFYFAGGAVKCDGSSPTLRNCVFRASRTYAGGGVACLDGSTATLEDCLFADNDACYGGGMAADFASPTMSRCRFVGNRAAPEGADPASGGGGFSCNGPSDAPILDDCVFEANTAVLSGAGGGGMACFAGTPRLTRCLFSGNSCAVWGGALEVHSRTGLTCTECTFTGNSADRGGAIGCWWYGMAILDRCSFYANRANSHGSAVGADTGPPPSVLSNCILASGEGTTAVGGCATLSCCDVWGNAGGDWVECIAEQADRDGNFSKDPLFCDPAAGDLRLRRNSPCVAESTGCGTAGAWTVGCD